MADRQLSDDELGLLVWCAISYDRRLPRTHTQSVPPHIWEMLSLTWKGRINDGTVLDAFGAEVKPPSSG